MNKRRTHIDSKVQPPSAIVETVLQCGSLNRSRHLPLRELGMSTRMLFSVIFIAGAVATPSQWKERGEDLHRCLADGFKFNLTTWNSSINGDFPAK